MLIITGTSHGKTDELTLYAIICLNVTIFYREELASLFQVQEKFKACSNSKWSFSRSSFMADDSHVHTVWMRVVVFSEHDILYFQY